MDSAVHGSQASMAMDIYLPNDCPVTLKIRDRTKRSDTARRHMLVRQTPIEADDDDPRCGKCNEHFRKSSKLDVRLCSKCGGDDLLLIPRKFTPKSSFDEYISRSTRGSTNDIPMKDQLMNIATQKHKYMRSNTIEDSKIRRKSDSFYKRKSSAQDKILKQKTNLSKSPTNSIRSFQEKRLSNLNLSAQFKNSNEYLKISNSKINESRPSRGGTPTGSRNPLNYDFIKTSRDSAGEAYLSANTDDDESVSDNSRMSPNHARFRQTRNHSYDSRQSSVNNEDSLRQTGSTSRLSSRQSSRQSEDRMRLDPGNISRQQSLKEELKFHQSKPGTTSQQGNAVDEAQKSKTGTTAPIGALLTIPPTNETNIPPIFQQKSNEIPPNIPPNFQQKSNEITQNNDPNCVAYGSNVKTNSSDTQANTGEPTEISTDTRIRNSNLNQNQTETSNPSTIELGDSNLPVTKPNIDFNSVSIEMIDEDDAIVPTVTKAS